MALCADVKTEKDPFDQEPPKQLRRTLDAIRYLESKTAGVFEGEGLVLRYGVFYGPGPVCSTGR
jgi:2-alkyl-3-oxoalkanoate reductase